VLPAPSPYLAFSKDRTKLFVLTITSLSDAFFRRAQPQRIVNDPAVLLHLAVWLYSTRCRLHHLGGMFHTGLVATWTEFAGWPWYGCVLMSVACVKCDQWDVCLNHTNIMCVYWELRCVCPTAKPYFQPSLSVSLSVCLFVSDRHFYPSTLTNFDETWSQESYSDLVWPWP